MATRVRELAAVVAEEYDGDAARVWTEATDAEDLRKRIGALPGFGEMKIKSLGSVLGRSSSACRPRESSRPAHPTLGDVTSRKSCSATSKWKRDYKQGVERFLEDSSAGAPAAASLDRAARLSCRSAGRGSRKSSPDG